MATSTRAYIGSGILKLPEFTWDYVDGPELAVAADVSLATITAGAFTLQVTSTIDTAGVDAWPSAGHFCIDGRVFTYTGISGTTFTGCNGGASAKGDQSYTAITAGQVVYQAVPAAEYNAIRQAVSQLMVYQASGQSGLNVTAAPGIVFDGTTELAYAGGTLALTDAATNYVYLYNNGGTATLAKNTTSWANPGVTLWPLAKIVCAGGVITTYTDERWSGKLAVPGGSYQPLDSELTAIAGLASAADKLPYFTGSGTAALADLTAFGRSLIDDAAASNARTTLGLGTAAVVSTYTRSLYLKAVECAGLVDPPTASVTGLGMAYRFTDSGAGEKVHFQVLMPGDYNGGDLTVTAYGASEYVAATGNAYFTAEAGDAADGGGVPPSMGTPATVTSAMAATGPGVLKQEIVSFAAITPAGSPAADRLMTIAFGRDSSNVADTFTNGIFHFVGLRIEYTTTGLGE